MTTTWKEQIQIEMGIYGESLSDIISSTLSQEQMNAEFDNSMNAVLEGIPFTIWTANRVYFPACYDTGEWCASVSRSPDGKPTSHVGGGG